MEYFPSQIVKAVEASRAVRGVALGIYYKERQIYFDTILRFVPISTPGCSRNVTLLWKKSGQERRKYGNLLNFRQDTMRSKKREQTDSLEKSAPSLLRKLFID